MFFVIDHATRAVQITGVTTNPDGAFMAQVARNLTDHVDGFVRGEASLRRALREFVAHYHDHRPHQGLGNEIIDGEPDRGSGEVVVAERLGGLLKHYHREAA